MGFSFMSINRAHVDPEALESLHRTLEGYAARLGAVDTELSARLNAFCQECPDEYTESLRTHVGANRQRIQKALEIIEALLPILHKNAETARAAEATRR